ncbi:MAG TPA: PilN domain-containing protein [Bryobacteraceae bacterium]|nr:PilN domain-containing protein [Bryobacteraceae bacterium]
MPSLVSQDVRKLLAFGSGIGIEIGAADLEVVAARVRPSRIQVLGRLTIHDYAGRPAAEWGAEYNRFLKSAGMSHLSASVLLPRREVIVRQVALAGVSGKDRAGAIRFQLDALHPYADEEVCWGWSPVGAQVALVGIARQETVDHYVRLFVEAGIAVNAFTFSAAALHAAVRLNGASGEGFLAMTVSAEGAVEVYGESAARPVFSAEFQAPPERAAALALAELRLPPETQPRHFEEVLPKPSVNPVENDLSRNALPYATALAGACPRLAPAANMLPAQYRRYSSRALWIPTVVLVVLLAAAIGAMVMYSRIADRRYLARLQADISRVEPTARRAAALDREIDSTRARARLLDQFRGQTRADLDAFEELTKLLTPPAWSNSIDLARTTARISGEAPQAAPLLKLLDASPLFENSEFQLIGRGTGTETFVIRTNRENPR